MATNGLTLNIGFGESAPCSCQPGPLYNVSVVYNDQSGNHLWGPMDLEASRRLVEALGTRANVISATIESA